MCACVCVCVSDKSENAGCCSETSVAGQNLRVTQSINIHKVLNSTVWSDLGHDAEWWENVLQHGDAEIPVDVPHGGEQAQSTIVGCGVGSSPGEERWCELAVPFG